MQITGLVRLTVIAAAAQFPVWGQPSPFPDAWSIEFKAETLGTRWAVLSTLTGHASSDGKTLEISVERGKIERPATFNAPQEISYVAPVLLRQGEHSKYRIYRAGKEYPFQKNIKPDETITLEPFRMSIDLTGDPLLKGDQLILDIGLSRTIGDGMSHGTIPLRIAGQLPVKRVAAYCADTWWEIGSRSLNVERVCQDSAGRIRRETWYYVWPEAPQSAANLRSVEILDPIAGLIYNLTPATKKATQRQGFDQGFGFGAVLGGVVGGLPRPADAPKPVDSDRSLGNKMVNGADAIGNLHTTVYPAGYTQGSPEITVTVETWYSYRIQTMMRRLRTDPQNGNQRYEVTSLRMGEPDPTLFQVPPDYDLQIVSGTPKPGSIPVTLQATIFPPDSPPSPPPPISPSRPSGGLVMRIEPDAAAAQLVHRVDPEFPEAAWNAHMKVTMRLNLVIGDDGSVENATCLGAHPSICQAAIDGVRQWRYRPFQMDGKPTKALTTVVMEFNSIDGRRPTRKTQ